MTIPFCLNNDELLQWFVSHCTRRHYPAKNIIIHAGDKPTTLYFLVSGSVSVSIENEQGRDLVLAYLSGGEFFGEMGLFDGQSRSACVTARADCEIAEIGYARFEQLYNEKPELLSRITSQLALKLRDTSRKVIDLAFLDVTGRVARAIMDIAQKPEAMTHPDGMQIKITRQELGRIVGCSREMVGRVIKELEEQGLISAHGKNIVVFGAR
ncbi:cAMP-activated global transcriptional regulator CRP [Catenovulum sp. SM1970]|uniref:cAMP-activated global transcriptional regulator CRP n=1 Tax=Marinifaba aquimaris TaxID=2741323 RepID=UPI0015720115|nr:cAMP-activated global transcriptional regulator CRP [Marinifaba aquimaris]NTS76771.1 cAMP-activated global transcriptional regulator CRP [Marinifaba aquimaris]